MTGTLLGVGVVALGIWGITIVFGAVDQLDRIGEATSGTGSRRYRNQQPR